MRFIKDYMYPITSIAVLGVGIAWSSGVRDEKLTNIQLAYSDLKTEVVNLRHSVEDLTIAMAVQQQQVDDSNMGRDHANTRRTKTRKER